MTYVCDPAAPTQHRLAPRRERAECRDDRVVVQLLHQAVATPSVSGQEHQLAQVLARAASGWGLSAFLDGAGNLQAWTAENRSNRPTLMLVGHLDTVPGGPATELRDGAVWGRGSVDAKGPLTAMLAAAARCTDLDINVAVVGAVEEETPRSKGAVWLRDNTVTPDALIVGEPSGWAGVTLGYKGKLDLTYRVDTPAAHSTYPGDKASEIATVFLARLFQQYGSGGNEKFSDISLAVPHLAGDCESANAALSFRTPIGCDVDGLVTWVNAQMSGGRLQIDNAIPAVRVRRSDLVARSLSVAIRRAGATPVHKLKSGTSDMNTLAAAWQVPMATYGPGNSALDHTDDEHLEVAEFLRSIEVLECSIRLIADHVAPPSAAGSVTP